jgi:hypothetical protein
MIDISLRKPQLVSIYKKKRANDIRAGDGGKYLTLEEKTEYFLAYMSNVVWIGITAYNGNAPIQISLKVYKPIESREQRAESISACIFYHILLS